MNTIRAVVVMLVPAGILGCAGSQTPKPFTPSGPEAAQTERDRSADELAGKNPNQAAIVIDPRIATMCSIPTAYFAFDSSALTATAIEALDTLARCFISGPARGKAMNIVGHADPRGETEYNFALGQRRAGAVAAYLADKGLSGDQMASSSRGEIDATGTDEESWARDRKVEILLAAAEDDDPLATAQ